MVPNDSVPTVDDARVDGDADVVGVVVVVVVGVVVVVVIGVGVITHCPKVEFQSIPVEQHS